MAKVPTQIAIAAFHEEEAAGQIADALKEAKKQGQLYYRNVAVIRKDEKDKVKIKETGDMSAGPGAGVGAVIGGAVGLFAGPAGLAAGAVIGGAGAALIDSGLDNKRLKQIGDVPPAPMNSAAIAGVSCNLVNVCFDLHAGKVNRETFDAAHPGRYDAGRFRRTLK